MGTAEAGIIKQAKLAKQPIPERIRNKPRLLPGLDFFLDAFYDLDTERDTSDGLCPIPWSAIRDYAQHIGLSGQDTEELLYVVRCLDSAHLSHLAAKRKAALTK